MKPAQKAEASSACSDLGRRAKAARSSAKRLRKAAPAYAEVSDPILAHITEAYRLLRICDEAFAAHERPGSGVTYEQAEDAQDALVAHCDDVLMQTRPTTAAGAVALARFAVDWFESQGVPLARDEHGTSVLRLIAVPSPLAERSGGLHQRASTTTSGVSSQDGAEAPRSATTRLPPPTPLDVLLAGAQRYAAEFDLSHFSVKDLARLYEVTRQADRYWGHVGNMPLCTGSGERGTYSLTSLGWFVEGEEQRMAYLRDRCVAEIAQRMPADDAERSEILCVRLMHEIDCNGRVDRLDAPDLLIEALKAWG